jgi:hypothetical protein
MDQEKYEKKLKIRAYVWTVGFTLMLAALMFFTLEKPHEEENAKAVLGALSNCFIVPAALVGGFGALSYMAKLGAYDGLVYSFKNYGLHTLIGGAFTKKKTQTFREYKEEKDEKGRRWFPHLLWVGLAALVIGIILAIVSEIL